jgi:hypothetical protein
MLPVHQVIRSTSYSLKIEQYTHALQIRSDWIIAKIAPNYQLSRLLTRMSDTNCSLGSLTVLMHRSAR